MTTRTFQSEYMYWAKHQAPVTYALSSSEVPPCHLDQLDIDIADLELDGASRYRDPELRDLIAAKSGTHADCVVMADGTSMANMLAMAALLQPGDEVVAEHPVYEPLVATARFLGATIRSFARTAPHFAIDPDAVAAAISPRTRLILITNLHNPTGNCADEATLRALGELAARNGARVLVDEVYLDAAIPAQRSAVHLGPEFITTNSLTKTYGLSGLRCGWILAEPELAERMWRLNELFGVAQAHAAERLSSIALEHLDILTEGLADMLAHNRGLANAFFAARGDLDAAPMRQGITCFPKLLNGDVEALNALLRSDYDTAIVPGRHFGTPEHFRLGIGNPTPIVEEGLKRLGAALDQLAAQ